jgi:hypothetical protein
MKYINDNYLLMRYLALDIDQIEKLDPLDKEHYLKSIKFNMVRIKVSNRLRKIKKIFK